MKKFIAVILAVIIALSALSVLSFAADDTVRFAVATDIHANPQETLPVHNPESELYFHARNSGNLYQEAIGILVSFLEKVEEEGLDFVLIPGDLTDSGTEEQHIKIAQVLKEFEDRSGIQVYTVPGNHDYKNTDVETFRNIYSQFGFAEALTADTNTASYTADLPGNYRLIAVDSNNPGKDGDGIDEGLLEWIEEQADKAVNDGKTIIYMMHHALLDPIPYATVIMADFVVRDNKEMAEKFTRWGINYVFSGHEHGNNISSYTGKNGDTVYDVLTTALTSYPLEYRVVTFSGDTVTVETEAITECNFDYLCDGYNEAQLELMRTDYTKYSYDYFRYSIEKKIAKYLTPEFIKDKLNAEEGTALAEAADTLMPTVTEALYMPMYGEGETVEALAKKTGLTLPESDYTCLFDLVTALVAKVYYGNENLPVESSPEGRLLITALNTMLKYILNKAGNDSVKLVLGCVMAEEKIPENIQVFVWNSIYIPCADGIYDVIVSMLTPVLDEFLVDTDLADRGCTFPLKRTAPSETISFDTFFAKIRSFIENIFAKIKAMLSI